MNEGDRRPPRVVRTVEWSFRDEWPPARRGVPLFGIFLILLGVFLALGQFVPSARIGASALFLAVGIVLLLVWARDRSHLALYAGIFVTALSLSDLLTAANVVSGPGWGTLLLGFGFLGIALVRAAGHAGWGWQLLLGALLAFSGGSQVVATQFGFNADALVGPVLIVLLGLLIVSRGMGRRRPY